MEIEWAIQRDVLGKRSTISEHIGVRMSVTLKDRQKKVLCRSGGKWNERK